MIRKVHVRKGDKVIVLSGDYKGKPGKVLEVSPKEGKVIVEGVNVVSKHVKPRREGDKGGIIQVEGAMYASKVAHYCEACKKGVRARVSTDEKGNKIKVCAKCGAKL